MNVDLWKNINDMEDYFISYFLYREGKSLDCIAVIRNESRNKVEKDILKARIAIKQKQKKKEERDFLLDIISLSKDERIERIKKLEDEERSRLVEEIYTRYTSFKSVEDRMILIWLIGELNSDRLLPFLRMELQSNRFNQKRLACSALGKLKRPETRPWLHNMIDDSNPQVRQYAIKALKEIGNIDTVNLLEKRRLIEDKAYVIKAIDESILFINTNKDEVKI